MRICDALLLPWKIKDCFLCFVTHQDKDMLIVTVSHQSPIGGYNLGNNVTWWWLRCFVLNWWGHFWSQKNPQCAGAHWNDSFFVSLRNRNQTYKRYVSPAHTDRHSAHGREWAVTTTWYVICMPLSVYDRGLWREPSWGIYPACWGAERDKTARNNVLDHHPR